MALNLCYKRCLGSCRSPTVTLGYSKFSKTLQVENYITVSPSPGEEVMPEWGLECLADASTSSPDIIEALNGLLIVPTGQEHGSPRSTRLDPDEFYVRSRPQDFFVEGRVFIKLHTEDASFSIASDAESDFSSVPYNNLAYSQLRRFVVIKAAPKENYCLCLYETPCTLAQLQQTDFSTSRPITTYSGTGLAKKGIDPSSHTVIHTTMHAPALLEGEPTTSKRPIRVVAVRPDVKLDRRSRLNYGKIYPVEWNIKAVMTNS
ncbi:MAG: hypothetical protein Q9205_006569 [Flavoplaca limonia]